MRTQQPIDRTAPFAVVVIVLATSVLAQKVADSQAIAQRTADTTLAEWLVDKDARVSELVGKRVINPSGKDLGEVEDLLATPGREQRPVVVLSIGGVLDIGDKWHATSLDQLRIAADGERLLLDKTEQELKDAPDFDYVPTHGERSPLPGVRGPETTNSIGRLVGATVVDDDEEPIGEIKDFVVSTGEKGTRAVVGLGEDAGREAEGRLVAIPLDDLHVELSAEEAVAVPQQARVRVDLGGTPVEALPVYRFSSPDPI
jgi:sporulation protein YlmC with PRC-barrel domain